MELKATPWKEASAACECCGKLTKTIWGDVSVADRTLAIYTVQWTDGAPEHPPNIDLIIGPWGDGADPNERVLIGLVYDPGADGGGFRIIDSETRPANSREVCGRALKREEVVGTPFAQEAFQLVDAIWLDDPRIDEVKKLRSRA